MQRGACRSFFFWPFTMVAAQNITAATEGFGGAARDAGLSAAALSHLNKRTFFFFSRGRGAVNTFPNKR